MYCIIMYGCNLMCVVYIFLLSCMYGFPMLLYVAIFLYVYVCSYVCSCMEEWLLPHIEVKIKSINQSIKINGVIL